MSLFRLFFVFYFFMGLSYFAAATSPINKKCSLAFQEKENNILVDGSVTKYLFKKINNLEKAPKFVNLKEELEGIQFGWGKAVESPKALQTLLPKNIYFVGHEQNHADGKGVVKKEQAGNWISLRYAPKDPLKGTNIGILSGSLVDWIEEDRKYLVRKDSDAAVIWLHGGGTKTTGYQTGATPTNNFVSFGVDMVSITLPWHDEGPRHLFKDSREFFDWLYDIVDQYIPKDKPVFLAGHSMGGFLSDIAMRNSADPSFKLGQRLTGFIPLAPVADLAPGKTAEEKAKLEQSFEEEVSARYQDMSPQDMIIFEEMHRDGKMSHLTFLYINLMMADNNWTLPKHKGDKFKPALVIVGEKDGLTYVGYEKSFEKYMKPLTNVTMKVVTPLIDKMGKIINHGGHVEILDKPSRAKIINGSDPRTGYEVYNAMLDFIGEHIGKELTKEKSNDKFVDNPNRGAHTSFITKYANNLLFRASLHGMFPAYNKLQKSNTEILSDLSSNMQDYFHAKKDVVKIQSLLDNLYSKQTQELLLKLAVIITPEKTKNVPKHHSEFVLPKLEPTTEEDIKNTDNTLENLKHLIKNIKNSIYAESYIPVAGSIFEKESIKRAQDLAKKDRWDASHIAQHLAETQELMQAYGKLKKEKEQINKERQEINKEFKNAFNELKQLTNTFKNNIFKNRKEVERDRNSSNRSKSYKKIIKVIIEEDDLLQSLLAKEISIRHQVEAHSLSLRKKNNKNSIDTKQIIESFPIDIAQQISQFELDSAKYQDFRKNFMHILYQHSNKEKSLREDEIPLIQELLLKIYGKDANLKTHEFNDGLMSKLLEKTAEISQLQKEVEQQYQVYLQKKKDYIEIVGFDFFKLEEINLHNKLEKNLLKDIEMRDINNQIKKWKEFYNLIPPQKVLESISVITGSTK